MTLWIIGAGVIALWLALRKTASPAAASTQAAQDAGVQSFAPTAATATAPVPLLANPTGGAASQVVQLSTIQSDQSIVHVNQHIIDPGGGSGPFRVLSVGNGALKLQAFLALDVTGSAMIGISSSVGARVFVPDGSLLRNLAATANFPSGGQEYIVREGRIRSS